MRYQKEGIQRSVAYEEDVVEVGSYSLRIDDASKSCHHMVTESQRLSPGAREIVRACL